MMEYVLAGFAALFIGMRIAKYREQIAYSVMFELLSGIFIAFFLFFAIFPVPATQSSITITTNVPLYCTGSGVGIPTLTAWTSQLDTGEIIELNGSTNTLITSFSNPQWTYPFQIAFKAGYPYGWVASESAGVVTIFNPVNGQVVDVLPQFNGPLGAALSPTRGYAYITNFDNNTLSIANITTGATIGEIHGGFNYPRQLAFSPDGTYAYIVNSGCSTPESICVSPVEPVNVVIVDTLTSSIVGSINFPFLEPIGTAISPNGSFAYVTDIANDSVQIIDTATSTIVGHVSGTFLAPRGVTFSPNGQYAYVATLGGSDGDITIIDVATNSVVGTIESGLFQTPSGIEFDPNLINIVPTPSPQPATMICPTTTQVTTTNTLESTAPALSSPALIIITMFVIVYEIFITVLLLLDIPIVFFPSRLPKKPSMPK
jgi:YVTN family beta-propeller protein